MPDPVRAAVVGVGAMGQNHARVYRELPDVDLYGIYDADATRARQVARDYDTSVRSMSDLLAGADVVSVAVPTEYHYETARECIDAGTSVLVEKPFVADLGQGRDLMELADRRGVTLQVGHIERFNPAIRKLAEIVSDLDIIAIDARRLGPPVDGDREIDETAVMDLMIHDLDIITALVDEPVDHLDAVGTAGTRYATATLAFESGVVGQLTASRITQEKERRLTLSAEDCRVKVDYIDQAIEIHRQSFPHYVEDDGGVHYHHENIVERVSVAKEEPLKAELNAFVDAATNGTNPVVPAEDGLRAIRLAQTIEDLATGKRDHTHTPPAVR